MAGHSHWAGIKHKKGRADKERSKIFSKLSFKIVLLDEEIKSKDSLAFINQDLKNELRDVTGQLGIQGSTLEQAKANNIDLNQSVKKLTEESEILRKDYDALKITLEESNQRSAAHKHDLQEFTKQFNEIVEKFDLIQVKYKETGKKNAELSKKVEYWSRVANTLQDEKEHLEETRLMLNQIASTMEEENQEYKGVAKIKQAELKKLKDTIKTMTSNINNLIEENTYLAGLTSELKEELAKPRYMSMAAIERSEGFKMPMGGKVKNYLGHGKPTLLKFKNGGSKNGN